MFGISREMVSGAVRHLFTTFGGYFVANGWMVEDDVAMIGGAVAVLAGFLWSAFAKKQA